MTRLSDEQVHHCPSADPEPPDVAEHRESAARGASTWSRRSLPINVRSSVSSFKMGSPTRRSVELAATA